MELLSGFKKTTRTGVDVLVNSSVRVDLTLQPGNVTESIDVTAEAPMLQTDRSDTGRKIETKTIEDLPLGGSHNFQNLSILVPGAAKPESPEQLSILQFRRSVSPPASMANRASVTTFSLKAWTTTSAQVCCRF